MATTNQQRPRVACEISSDRVVVARLAEKSAVVEAATATALPEGTLVPGLQAGNIAGREALVAVLRDALVSVAGRLRDVTLIIPDATVRVMLLDFDSLPEKPLEAEAVVRFRLKKSLPFDVDHAMVSFDRQASAEQTPGATVRVVAAIIPREVLAEYEGVVREAGYNPGAVIPSTIAALGAVDGSRPTMVIKAENGTTTFAIVNQEQLLLYRALENKGSIATGESLVEDANTSLVYFEDRYSVGVDRILVAGVQSAQALQTALGDSEKICVEDLISSGMAGAAIDNVPRSSLAAVVGALAS